jgi:hypothetical protein
MLKVKTMKETQKFIKPIISNTIEAFLRSFPSKESPGLGSSLLSSIKQLK